MKITEEQIWSQAFEVGEKKAKATVPEPMIVGTPKTFFGNEIDETKKTYFVQGGVCGFGWVVIKPATGKFVKWLKAQNIGCKNYGGGYRVSAHPQFTKSSPLCQSLEINEAWASGFAEVLREYGIQAYAESRMD